MWGNKLHVELLFVLPIADGSRDTQLVEVGGSGWKVEFLKTSVFSSQRQVSVAVDLS